MKINPVGWWRKIGSSYFKTFWLFVTSSSTSLVRRGTGGTQKQLFLTALKIFGLIPWFLLGGRISYWDAKMRTRHLTNFEEEAHIWWVFFPGKQCGKNPVILSLPAATTQCHLLGSVDSLLFQVKKTSWPFFSFNFFPPENNKDLRETLKRKF